MARKKIIFVFSFLFILSSLIKSSCLYAGYNIDIQNIKQAFMERQYDTALSLIDKYTGKSNYVKSK